MSQATLKLNVNGFVNLGSAIKAAGYTGTFQISFLKIVNENDQTLFVHLTNNGMVAPAVGADGDAVGNNDPSVSFLFSQRHPEQFLDAGATWLYAAVAVTVVVTIAGGGI